MTQPGPARGVLRPPQALATPGRFHHQRYAPPLEVSGWVAHFWHVAWDLRGLAEQTQHTLPHPNVHLVFESTGSSVVGVQHQRFTRRLSGQGQVFGIKFRPGGFYPLLGRSVSQITNQVLALDDLFGPEANHQARQLLACSDLPARCTLASQFVLAYGPKQSPSAHKRDRQIDNIAALVDSIAGDRTLNSVDELVRRTGLNKRSLQRLFQDHVGVSPKWVIQRYRLHEAIEQLHAGAQICAADLALSLGYFDQAHFIHDFKALIGCTPSEYGRGQEKTIKPSASEGLV